MQVHACLIYSRAAQARIRALFKPGGADRALAMDVSDRVRKALERTGMTVYEVKSYATLLAGGPQNAASLSAGSGVPHSKIYEALTSLEDKGWVRSDDSRPTVYTPLSPETGLEAERRRTEERLREDGREILAELGPVFEKGGTGERPDILVISGAENIVSRVLEMLEACKEELMVAMPQVSAAMMAAAMPRLRLLHDRGVGITALVSDKTDGEAVRALSRVSSVSVRSGMFGGGIISDRLHVVILLEGKGADTVAIWAEHAGLAGLAREYFEYLVREGKKA